MMNEKDNKGPLTQEAKVFAEDFLSYPAGKDIYSQLKEAEDIDPEDISIIKEANENDRMTNEKDFNDDVSGNGLDIPGSELDDEQENIGSEDEENNHYSIGGDNHNDLEEDNGQ